MLAPPHEHERCRNAFARRRRIVPALVKQKAPQRKLRRFGLLDQTLFMLRAHPHRLRPAK
jgi:hypothetical protein